MKFEELVFERGWRGEAVLRTAHSIGTRRRVFGDGAGEDVER